jgi:hypothetical protein
MPKFETIDTYNITAAGGTKAYDLAEDVSKYIITASPAATLVADMIFSASGTPYDGLTFNIIYTGGVTSNSSGGITVSFFGTDLTDAEALTALRIEATYYNGAWSIGKFPYNIFSQPSIWGSQIVDGTLGADAFPNGKMPVAKIADLTGQGYVIIGGAAGAVTQLNAAQNGYILIGNGTTLQSVAQSGDVTFSSAGVSAIGNDKVVTAMILDDNVTVAKVEDDLKRGFAVAEVTFETGEQGDYKIEFPFPCTVEKIYARATKAIAATDDGTITPKDNAGTTMTAGTITFTASDAFGTAYSSTPTANNTFAAGEYMTLTTAKTTAGGKVQVTVKYIKT